MRRHSHVPALIACLLTCILTGSLGHVAVTERPPQHRRHWQATKSALDNQVLSACAAGGTHVPAVQRLVQQATGILPVAGLDPELCVALGAGIQVIYPAKLSFKSFQRDELHPASLANVTAAHDRKQSWCTTRSFGRAVTAGVSASTDTNVAHIMRGQCYQHASCNPAESTVGLLLMHRLAFWKGCWTAHWRSWTAPIVRVCTGAPLESLALMLSELGQAVAALLL